SGIGRGHRLSIEGRRGGIEIGRIYELGNAFRRWGQRCQGLIDCSLQLFVNFLFQFVNALLVENSLPQQKHLSARNRVAGRIALALRIWTVQALVIRERMRIGANHVRMNECRSMASTAVLSSALECGATGYGIGAVDFFEMEIREAGDQPRNTPAR